MTTISFQNFRIALSGSFSIALFCMLELLCTQELQADDWPQWRGPNRDGVWRETGILESIPSDGLKFRWRARIGRGYSGPVVAKGRVFVTDHQFNPEVERVLCFDEVTGKPIWTQSYPVDYEHMEYGNGPRASPTVHEGKVYTLGTQGHLFCLDAITGKVLWKKDLAKEYNARVPQYGASVAPLIEGELVIICIGGQPESSVIAFDRNNGNERWKALKDRPAYSAPIIINKDGHRQVIIWTADNISSLNPATGKVYWQVKYKASWNEAQAVASPVLHKNWLLCVMAWNRGSMMLNLDTEKPAASQRWKTRSRPTTQFSTPLFNNDDYFYSIDNTGGLCCLNAKSGDEVWRSSEVSGSSPLGHAHLTPNGNRVFLFNQRGQLVLARITSKGYQELGRALLVEPTSGHRAQGPVAWAHPAYANKHVIARNDRELVSISLDSAQYSVSKKPATSPEIKVQVLSEFVGRNSALSLDFSHDGQTLALGTWMGDVKLLNLSNGKEKLPAPPKIRNNCCAVTLSPDGKLLAYAGGSEFKQVRNNRQTSGKVWLWDMTKETAGKKLEGHTNKVNAAIFSPDGKTLATGSADKTVRLWDATTGKARLVLKGHKAAIWSLAYSPDGKILVSVSWDKTVKFWNMSTGLELATVKEHEEEILSVAISPDGKTMATGSADWTVRLWDMATKKRLTLLKGHKGAVYCLAFSSDSKTLASGSGDETVKLWDVETRLLRTTLVGHKSGITALAYSPNDKILASAGRDDPVRLWQLKNK